jgi:lactoylglutathione lyase
MTTTIVTIATTDAAGVGVVDSSASSWRGWVTSDVDGAATPVVRQMRLVVTVDDYDGALAFYRDVLGLRQEAAFAVAGGRVAILEAGRATLEITDRTHAAYIDEVEVGRRVAGTYRVAFEVENSVAATQRLVEAGATLIASPTETPWRSLNARLQGPDLQLTLFQELDGSPSDQTEGAT